MADVRRSHLRKAGTLMSKVRQLNQLPAQAREAPVRIKLERINCDVGKLLPPEGSHREWVGRLQAAMGTRSTVAPLGFLLHLLRLDGGLRHMHVDRRGHPRETR